MPSRLPPLRPAGAGRWHYKAGTPDPRGPRPGSCPGVRALSPRPRRVSAELLCLLTGGKKKDEVRQGLERGPRSGGRMGRLPVRWAEWRTVLHTKFKKQRK